MYVLKQLNSRWLCIPQASLLNDVSSSPPLSHKAGGIRSPDQLFAAPLFPFQRSSSIKVRGVIHMTLTSSLLHFPAPAAPQLLPLLLLLLSFPPRVASFILLNHAIGRSVCIQSRAASRGIDLCRSIACRVLQRKDHLTGLV